MISSLQLERIMDTYWPLIMGQPVTLWYNPYRKVYRIIGTEQKVILDNCTDEQLAINVFNQVLTAPSL